MKLSFKIVQIFEKKSLVQNFTTDGTYIARQTLFVVNYSNREKINIVSSFKIYTYIGSNDLNYRNYH